MEIDLTKKKVDFLAKKVEGNPDDFTLRDSLMIM